MIRCQHNFCPWLLAFFFRHYVQKITTNGIYAGKSSTFSKDNSCSLGVVGTDISSNHSSPDELRAKKKKGGKFDIEEQRKKVMKTLAQKVLTWKEIYLNDIINILFSKENFKKNLILFEYHNLYSFKTCERGCVGKFECRLKLF